MCYGRHNNISDDQWMLPYRIIFSCICSNKLTETWPCTIFTPFTSENSYYHCFSLSFFFFFYFVSTKVRDKNFIVLIVKIIMTLVVVVVRIIVVRMITTTNNGGFQFLECPECTDTVLISILSPCNNPWGKCYSHFKV